MSLVGMVTSRTGTGFPRVSGDEPDRGVRVDLDLAFSPRERG